MLSSCVISLLLLFSSDNISTEMFATGKNNGELHITNVLGEEYCVENYMDPVSRIVYFKTDGLPQGVYYLRFGAKSDFLIISQ